MLPPTHRFLLGFLILTPQLVPSSAVAQSRDTDPLQLDAIIVTAGKREQSLREVAGSVSAIGGGELESNLARGQEDIFKLTPGVQFNKGDPDRAMPTIRAVGTVLNAGGLGQQQGTTGLYIGDVPVTDPFGYVMLPDVAPLDLDRVEILRGPQGALFGSGALGGAVRYVFAAPRHDHNTFSGLLDYGHVSGGGSNTSLAVSGNLVLAEDAAGLRVMAYDRNDSGYIDNLGTGQFDANALSQRGGRFALSATPVENLNLEGTLFTQRTDIDDSFAIGPDPERLQIDTPTPSTRDSRFDLAQFNADYTLGKAMLGWTSALLRKRVDGDADATRMAAPLGVLLDPSLPAIERANTLSNIASRGWFHELRLSGSSGPGTYVVGASYQRNRTSAESVMQAPGTADSWGPYGALLPGDIIVLESSHTHSTEKALFGTYTHTFNERLSLELGGRYYRNTVSYDIEAMQFAQEVAIARNMSESGFTPRASLSWRFGEHMAYVLVSRGYRFGGVNAATGIEYATDSLWNYEAGLRLTPARNLQFDLTAFVLDWSDAQVNARMTTPGEMTVFGITNVGQASIRGLEMTAHLRLSSSWDLNLSSAHTHAETRSDYESITGAVIPSGTRMPSAPRFQSSAQLGYRFDGPLQTQGTFNLVHQYVGRRQLALELPGEAGSYQSLNARLNFARDRWEVGLHASNLLDERGIVGGGANTDLAGGIYDRYYLLRPRTYGISFRYDY